ncbi:hypothetical protein K435DRAFT_848574 [Dendrothele bispora CBS 962.96]|uniref:YEATS domain-containing protein n=1 Tax=Dendrothele bispora (strain CBS 962.96) TaxID=1314807 RepID=A0A4S8MUI9_DENBC|nr:hypothetical protein K435DRAFT_848574 [Dendrothele bispora CBS 962.96]
MQSDRGQLDLEESILLTELDIEIGLRERLAVTLESRIKWAALLQEALNNEAADVSEVVFKDAALNALTAIDSTSDILFTRENFAPIPVIQNVPKGRPAPKEKPLTRSQKSKFIYLRSSPSDAHSSSSHNQIYVLRCPTCLRTSFTNLQGLYNHARISHSAGWGTHEECVRVCSVPKSELEAQLGHELDLEAGIDIGAGSGILPGVKSLFQMAVEGTRDRTGNVDMGMSIGEKERSVHLTKTLGLHGDSPALAQFLGKEAKRKEIKVRVEDENAELDIDGFDDENAQRTKRRWRKPNTHQYGLRDEESIDVAVPAVEDLKSLTAQNNGSSLETSNPAVVQSSRFRMACRVIITDSSLFIPPERRPESAKDHTHKWMLSIESASYSIDLTTVLTSMTVTSIPLPNMDPMDFVPIPALTVTEPPYLVVGTTSEPFHAQIELVFKPGGSTHGGEAQRIILEHWVGLDMLGTSKLPVMGDEQMMDVELDKDTEIGPAKTGYPSASSKLHWEAKSEGEMKREYEEGSLWTEAGASTSGNAAGANDTVVDGQSKEIGWEECLKSLLPKFPITLKDAKLPTSDVPSTKRSKASNATSIANAVNALKLPYRLVASQEELKGLIMGRRKAIEWARAKALRDAYTERVKQLQPQALDATSAVDSTPTQSDASKNSALMPLTTGDVFCWLEDNGYFFREAPPPEEPKAIIQEESSGKEARWTQLLQKGKWCKVCGLGLWAHGIVDIPETTNVTPGTEQSAHGHGRRASASVVTSVVVNRPSYPTEPGLYDAQGTLLDNLSFKCNIMPDILQLYKLPIVNAERIFLKHIQRRRQQIQVETGRRDTDVDMDVDETSSSPVTPTPFQTQIQPFERQSSASVTLLSSSSIFAQTSPWQKRLLNRDLVSVSDPRFVEALRNVVGSLNLRTFQFNPPAAQMQPEYPLSSIAASSSDVDALLAPYSVLALATKRFIQYLVKEGLEVNLRDKDLGLKWMQQNNVRDVGLALSGLPSRKSKAAASATGSAMGGGRRERDKEKAKVQTTRVLTPMHILAGVIAGYVKAGSVIASTPSSAAATFHSTTTRPSFVPSYTASVTANAFTTPKGGAGLPKVSHSAYGGSSSSNQDKFSTAVAVFGCLARLGISAGGIDLD